MFLTRVKKWRLATSPKKNTYAVQVARRGSPKTSSPLPWRPEQQMGLGRDRRGPIDDIDGEKDGVWNDEVVEVVPFPEVPSFSLQVGEVSETRSDDEDDQADRLVAKAESESVVGSESGSGTTSSTRSPSRGTASTVEELYSQIDECLAISKAATSAVSTRRMSGSSSSSSTDEIDSNSKVIEENNLTMTLRGTCEADLKSAYDVSGRMKKAISLGRIALSWGGRGRKASFEVSEKPRSRKERRLSAAVAAVNSFEKSRSLADLRLAAAVAGSSVSVAVDPNPERLL